MLLFLGIIIVLIYMASPIWGKLLLLVVNVFIPDPIPIVDEAIMVLGLVSNLVTVMNVWEFIGRHKVISTLLGIGLLVIIAKLVMFII